jgi:hypothetical protein
MRAGRLRAAGITDRDGESWECDDVDMSPRPGLQTAHGRRWMPRPQSRKVPRMRSNSARSAGVSPANT